MNSLYHLINSLRSEENERLPHIADILNGLVKKINNIKTKSENIMNDIETIDRN